MKSRKLRINNKEYSFLAQDEMPLLWVLRDVLNLKGTKFGCGKGFCGSCTVHINSKAIRSCSVQVKDCVGLDITTIEGLNNKIGQKLVNAWVKYNVPQCGYCQPGQVMKACALLVEKSKPNLAAIRESMNTNICRCGTYQRIEKAIYFAAHNKELTE